MFSRTQLFLGLVAVALLPLLAATSAAQTSAEADFQRGYYLQTHEGDVAEAVDAFEKVLADPNAPGPLRAEAQRRLAECREDLATADFARLMPPEPLVYVELNRPGDHVARLAEMLGLVHEDGLAPSDLKPGATRLDGGLYFPENFTISPALVAEARKLHGGAVAVTSLDEHGPSGGLAVLHPGNSDLLRGLLETSIQVLEPADPIDGFRTFRGPKHGWITATNRVFLVSQAREEIAAAIARMKDPSVPSLANQEALKPFADDRQGSLLFAYVDGRQLFEELEPRMAGRDAAVVRSVLDLDHVQSLAAAIRTSETGVHVQARLDLTEGHHNLAYAMIRTAPLTGRSLRQVPAGSAAVVLLGLNPHETAHSGGAAGETMQYLTGMDLGREVFGNIEDVALYVLPAGDGAAGPPDVGAVLAVKDPARSEALWNQLLTLPATFETANVEAPREIALGDSQGREFHLPNLPPLVVLRRGDDAILVGTKRAVTASVEGEPIAQDPAFHGLLERLTPHTSKAVLVHVGRALGIAHKMAKGHEAEELERLSRFLSELRLSVVTDEQPTRFSVRADATGLPNVPEIVKALAPASTASRRQGASSAGSVEAARTE